MSRKPNRNGSVHPPVPDKAPPRTFWQRVKAQFRRLAAESAALRSRVNSYFTRLAKWSAWRSGRPGAFMLAVLVVLVWLVTGPIFNYSDTWQLVINTGTTIITFLMVFVIQNTQNRDSAAIQIKLDELIRAVEGAHNSMLNLEELEDEELETLRHRYISLAEKAKQAIERGKKDLGCPELDKEEEAIEAIKANGD